ncbi:DUF3826 domain-containing protein [Chitinophaga sp.]|uniref:DUF3826 domain-containing protein n=1 Tax=Chitinophaga sp. TaxID=1869181 RepID=UPI002CB0C378|nr:DUF3826 domain-containing protein [Chitinophaga sp.]HWV67176.1 DUF3826 domain-containing protein [Chitinophaga sp.]
MTRNLIKFMKKGGILLTGVFLWCNTSLFALQAGSREDSAYIRVANQRADKIVATLGVAQADSALLVRDVIAGQYRHLNEIQAQRDQDIKSAREKFGDDKPALAKHLKEIEDANSQTVEQLHTAYLSKLSAYLNPQQVNQVKDGMTYGVLPLTYRVYNDMLPNLTTEQKAQIMAWLVEARERAMDAGSSEKKHQWFGKYKGRINNYLSSAGINMKQAEEEWKKRKAATAN